MAARAIMAATERPQTDSSGAEGAAQKRTGHMATVERGRPDVGLLLRRYRLVAGLTQEELAARARLSPRAISDLERGAARIPRRDTVAA